MKKIYQTPETIEVVIKAVHMVCQSIYDGGNASDNDVISADGRGGSSLWDDDEDEDY